MVEMNPRLGAKLEGTEVWRPLGGISVVCCVVDFFSVMVESFFLGADVGCQVGSAGITWICTRFRFNPQQQARIMICSSTTRTDYIIWRAVMTVNDANRTSPQLTG